MKKKYYILLLLLFGLSKSYSQVGIGTDSPDQSSLLELESKNKGFLLTRISLKSINDTETINLPATGLMVYNTNKLLEDGEGIYYNYQTPTDPLWKKISTLNSSLGNDAAGQIIRYPLDVTAKFGGTKTLQFQRDFILPNGVNGAFSTIKGSSLKDDNSTIILPMGIYRIDISVSGILTPRSPINSGSIDFYIDNSLYSYKHFSAGGTQTEMIILDNQSELLIKIRMFDEINIEIDADTTGRPNRSTLFITKIL